MARSIHTISLSRIHEHALPLAPGQHRPRGTRQPQKRLTSGCRLSTTRSLKHDTIPVFPRTPRDICDAPACLDV